MDKDKIKFTVDRMEAVESRSALPNEVAEKIATSTVELSLSAIERSIGASLSNVAKLFEKVEIQSEKYAISEIEFNILVDGTGEISILSVSKLGISAGTGISIKMTRTISP